MRQKVVLNLINNECLIGKFLMLLACFLGEDFCPGDVPDCECETECTYEGFDCNPEGCLTDGKCTDEDDD